MLYLLALTLLLSLPPHTTHAQERIRIAWAGATPTNAPIWVVVENS